MVSVTLNGEGYSGSFPLAVKSVEDNIRAAINARNVRLTEYFKDYDRLRTGFITKPQFDRCLDQLFGIVLSTEDDQTLMGKYMSRDPKQSGMVNYRRFCEVIAADFEPNALNLDPSSQRIGSTASEPVDRRPLSPASLSKCDELLHRMARYYHYHGINIKTCYADFDKHHIGVVTESQFYRSFPGPPDVTEGETRLLAKKYRDPERAGLCNYYSFHEDISEKQKALADEADFTKLSKDQGVFDDLRPKRPSTPSLQDIFEKIRVAVYKNGVRTTEFFKDHDKLRSGEITENQFVCGLSLCCSSQANLTREEIKKVVDHYKTEDGRVKYKEFCDTMENAFNVPDLEKKPTSEVYRPMTGSLAKAPNLLTPGEEQRVTEILQDMADKVRKRRLMVYPYFKDFDRSKGYTRGVTKPQFARMLHFLSLDLQSQELALLCRKFEYPFGGDINYPAFIQAIDSEYIGTATTISDFSKNRPQSPPKSPPALDVSSVDLAELVGRIRHHVLVNSLRVEEFFQDFDALRHGSISASQFRRCLDRMVPQQLTKAGVQVLAQHYADPKLPGNVKWTKFLEDIDIVFTKRGLEKIPTHQVAAMETFRMSRPGEQSGEVSDSQEELLNSIQRLMTQKIKQRRILCKPSFQDFDNHNNGHVTRSQARQCLLNLSLTNNEEEMKAVEAKYSDDTGFNYIKFLEDVQPSEKPELKYVQRLEELKRVNQKVLPDLGEEDTDLIMHKIRSKVIKERVRVLEFMRDYDKLRTGRMLKSYFPRALDMCNLGLTKAEATKIMDRYISPAYPDYVDYLRFSDDIEESFTLKGLEKTPLVIPQQYHLHPESENRNLLPEAEVTLERVMERLAQRVRIRRIQLFPLFEDYDRVHNGTVSRSQFHRVLSELELGSLVSAREFAVLYKRFDVVVGLKHDFNYIAFCDLVNEYAKFEYGKP